MEGCCCRDAYADPPRRVFISHAGADSGIAKRLHDDLEWVGHNVRIDLQELGLGDDVVAFMNRAIADADLVIILFSKNSSQAQWQNMEINAAVWHEAAQRGGRVVVLRLDAADLPPLLGPKVYGSLEPDTYHDVVRNLCMEL